MFPLPVLIDYFGFLVVISSLIPWVLRVKYCFEKMFLLIWKLLKMFL